VHLGDCTSEMLSMQREHSRPANVVVSGAVAMPAMDISATCSHDDALNSLLQE